MPIANNKVQQTQVKTLKAVNVLLLNLKTKRCPNVRNDKEEPTTKNGA